MRVEIKQHILIPNDSFIEVVPNSERIVRPGNCTGMLVINSQDSGSFSVRITDGTLGVYGDIAYKTKALKIEGIDIRMCCENGDIEYDNGVIRVHSAQIGVGSTCALSIKGTGLRVSDIRTADIKEIKIVGDEKVVVKVCERKRGKNRLADKLDSSEGKSKFNWWWLAFVLCFCFFWIENFNLF